MSAPYRAWFTHPRPRRRSWRRFALEWLENRVLLSASPLMMADNLELNTVADGTLSSAIQQDVYKFTVSEAQGNGRLSATVATTSGSLLPRLTLSGSSGNLLIQSDSRRITQHLKPGSYTLRVSTQTGLGSYQITTDFSSANPPLAALVAGGGTRSVELGDLNGDGIQDVVASNFSDNSLSVFFGHGDGTLQPEVVLETGPGPISVTIADINGDGRPDLLTANKYNNSVSVLRGIGEGSCQPKDDIEVGTRPSGVAAADMNGDGVGDLVASNYTDSTVSVVLGNRDATFQQQQVFATALGPGRVRIADLNGDGIPDVITPNYYASSVSVLLGNGDGSLQERQDFATGAGPYSLAIGDINGDGLPDVATSDYIDHTVSVLLGKGDGTFQPHSSFNSDRAPYTMAMADINGDGALDIATANFADNSVSVLLGNGDGTLREPTQVPAGQGAGLVALGDLDGDGRPEIVTANFFDDTVSVLPGRGDGTFATPSAAPATSPNLRPYGVVTADLNGDGLVDIVAATKGDNGVSILLGNPDGSFRAKQSFRGGTNPNGVAVADLSGDGIPDIVTANYTDDTVSVLLGAGDGTFAAPQHLAVGAKPYNVTIADITGDGIPDLIVPNSGDSTLSLLVGHGDGTFLEQQVLAVQTGTESNRTVTSVTVADFNADGNPDLALGNFNSTAVLVLFGNGDGSFQQQQSVDVGAMPLWLATGDFNGDGTSDLVAANLGDNSVSVLLSNGDGTFQRQQVFPAGTALSQMTVGDFNGDGHLDIVAGSFREAVGYMLAGNGDGTLRTAESFTVDSSISGLAAVDSDNDGRLDLITYNHTGNTVTDIAGIGDGTFQVRATLELGSNRFSVWVADIDSDGRADIVRSDLLQNSIRVDLGNGTGTFEPGVAREVGAQPTAVTATDLNGDGRTDIVVANSDDDSLSVLLGNGDGTFHLSRTFPVGRSPRAVVAADIDGDGIPDLVAANYNDDSISVLLGSGDGTFTPGQTQPVGRRPYALAVADVNGDGHPDVLVTSSADNSLDVLHGTGDGSFRPSQSVAVGRQPLSIAVVDVNGDSILDALVANAADGTASVLLGSNRGLFSDQHVVAVGPDAFSITAADVNGDGRLDLITTSFSDNAVSILSGNGDGTFQLPRFVGVGTAPVQIVASDINDDGRPDLVTVGNRDNSTGVLLSIGDGEFQQATTATEVRLRNTPLRADLDSDGIPDSVVLDRLGNILFRKRLSSTSGLLAPPVILNEGFPARDVAILRSRSGVSIVAADARFDPALSDSQFVFPVAAYTVGIDGTVRREIAVSTTDLPARLVAVDLTGDGLDELVLANPLDNTVTIAIQTTGGRFSQPITLMTGIAPSDIAVADVNRDGRPDVLASNQASGDVTVLLNDSSHQFGTSLRFRASTQPYAVDNSSGSTIISSFAQSVSLVAGDFTSDGYNDIVIVNRGAHSYTVLEGNGRGGFENPRLELTTSTSSGRTINNRPGASSVGDFNGDGQRDVAVLMEDTGLVWIYSGQGDGTFEHTFTIPVGDRATGLSIVQSLTSAFSDLLVGNGFGDVLHLEGKGDGTFQIQGNRVSLSVVPDLFGPGQAGVLVGNQQDNRVTVQTQSEDGNEFETVDTLGEGNAAQLAPGDVQFALLSRDSKLPDAVVVSTGGNAVIVYHTIAITNGAPVFAAEPQTFFVGTAPVSATMADINGDGIADMLIANRGSNDVSVLFGSYDTNGAWLGITGPRLRSGGAGPISVAVRELTGDNVLDLVVINGQSGTLTVLPGVGQGFFDDRSPQTLMNLDAAIVEPPTFVGTSDIGFAVTADGKLLQFDLSDASRGARVVFSADQVLSARALPNGQVVVAVAGGSVKILAPDGDVLIVVSVLEAQGGVPIRPSSLAVLQTGSGGFQVLVSSQGSDTVSVFAAGSTVLPFVVNQPVIIRQTGPSLAGSSFLIFSSFGTSVFASTASVKSGLSLSGFSSLGRLVFNEGISAALVAVDGDSYSNVAVLDFGTQKEDLSGDGRGRQPWLSDRYYFGDTSPLTRFVIGLEKAVQGFRLDTSESHLSDDTAAPSHDPWTENLFPSRPPSRPPKVKNKPAADEPDTDVPMTDEDVETGEGPEASEDIETMQSYFDHDCFSGEEAQSDSYWQQYPHNDDQWILTSTAASRSKIASANAAVLLAGSMLTSVSLSDFERPRKKKRTRRSADESRR